MDKREVEKFLTTLCPIVFCKFCSANVPRQEIGHHYRSKAHIENLERARTHGTYEDLITYSELYVIAIKCFWQRHLSDEEYDAIHSLDEDPERFFEENANV